MTVLVTSCGGGSSVPTPTPNPVPSLTSISPTSATAGDAGFSLTVNGSNFISGSVVRWGPANRPTTFLNSTSLTGTIAAADIANPRNVEVTVFNAAPGGGTSNALTFSIGNPGPILSSLSPSSVAAGSPDFTLTVNGTKFVSTSVVQWNGGARTTTFVSSTQLTANIPVSDVASAAVAQVTVFNPSPGGGTSAGATFTITATLPLALKTLRLPDTTGGKNYNFALSASGGVSNPNDATRPYVWTIASGNLPAGLTLDSMTGRISGTVTGATQTFTVQVADFTATPNTATRDLTIQVLPPPLGRNDFCTSESAAGTTQISNGTIHSSFSPYGDVDVYSFQGKAGSQVSIETFAQRLDLDGNSATRDSQTDTILELLDSNCAQLTFNDDLSDPPNHVQDSLINFTLPATGLYFIRVRDFRGDGRPDLIYELSLTGADE